MSRTRLGVLTSSGHRSNFFSGGRNGSSTAQLSLHLVNSIHNSVGGDGGAGNLVDISQSERRNLANELSLERFFQSARTVAGGFIEEGVADGDFGDRAGIIQRQGNSNGTGKALYAGSVGRSAFATHIHDELTGGVDAAVDRSRGNGSAGNSVNYAVLQTGGTFGKGQGNTFADKLVSEAGFLGLGAQAGSFAEIVAANIDTGNDIIGIQTNGYNNFTSVAADSRFNNVANAFAIGVETFIATVHSAAFVKLYLLEGGGCRQQTGTGLLCCAESILSNRTFGDQVENSQQQSGHQTNANQRHQIAKELLHNGKSSFVFASEDA